MKISLSWLREHLRTDKSASEIARILTVKTERERLGKI